jgi:hypothetical protein
LQRQPMVESASMLGFLDRTVLVYIDSYTLFLLLLVLLHLLL